MDGYIDKYLTQILKILYVKLVLIMFYVFFPAKTNKEGKQEPCKAIQKVEWKCSKTG